MALRIFTVVHQRDRKPAVVRRFIRDTSQPGRIEHLRKIARPPKLVCADFAQRLPLQRS
jgi:hypothetical protein